MNFAQWKRATWQALAHRRGLDADRRYTQEEVSTVLEAAVTVLFQSMISKWEGLGLQLLGRFQIVERPPQIRVNNLTGERYLDEGKTTVLFKPSPRLLAGLNKPDDPNFIER